MDRISLELARRERDEKIRYFVLHGGQRELLAEICRPGAYIVGAGAGNGWGKSKFVVAFLAAVCFPEMAPAAFTEHELVREWPYPKRARIISTPKEVEEIGSIQTAILELFPDGRYTPKTKGKHYPSQFKTDTGWKIDVMTYEQEVGEFAGPDIGLQIFNEPMPEGIWKESLMRSRAGGIILFAMTSLYENPWVVDGILGKANGKDMRVRYGSSEENCKQHGDCGHLEHDHIDKILSHYDPDEREARLTGKPLSMSGRIFKTFDRSIHVAAEEFEPPEGGVTIGMAVDPAIAKPLAILWRYVDSAGVLNYYDEYPEVAFEGAKDSNLTVIDYAQIIKSKEKGRAVESRILDRHFGAARRSMGGKTLKEEFSDAGLDFSDSYSMDEEVETGISKIKEMLRYDTSKPIDTLNRPRIRISPKCHNLIVALERWGRNPATGKPQDAYKDFIDVLRYDVMSNPEIDTGSNWKHGRKPFYGVS